MDNFFDENENLNYRKSRLKRVVEFIGEIVKIAVISLIIILPVRYFLIQPFYVKGASMEPNFYDHEYLIIDEITYRFSEPERGDTVVFKYPKDPKQYFIKRLVGLPGEQIQIKDGDVYIISNGEVFLLDETYLPEDIVTNLPLRGYSDVVLRDDEFFLLGDNRDQSLDSRVFGPVKREFIVGRTWLRGWPLNRITIFDSPEYNL